SSDVCSSDLLFELRRDVSLRIDERLLADVVVRDLILVRVGDLEVVAEDLVEADLEGRDAGSLRLFLLHTDQPVFAGACDTPALVELFVEPIADKASLTHAGRWVIHQGAPDFADEIVAGMQFLANVAQRFPAFAVEQRADGGDLL